MHAGIKTGGRRDVSLLATDDGKPVPAAAVFTQNKFRAPPVEASLERLQRVGRNGERGDRQFSGNANAGTGAKGRADAEAMCAAAARGGRLRPARHAGLLDRPDRLPPADAQDPDRHSRGSAQTLSRDGHRDAAKGILTTDTRPKEAQVVRDDYSVGGMAKGCGMLAPNMATMLAFLTTDAELSPEELKPILFRAADATFNALITDGATSTNDTVMLFASGRKGRPADLGQFEDDVRQVCEELMLQMARDAEGMTKLVVIRVTGAASDAEARKAARSIGNNQLIKCSWYGADAYWGRLLAEAGSCGVEFDTERSSVSYGGIKVAEAGVEIPHDADAVLNAYEGRGNRHPRRPRPRHRHRPRRLGRPRPRLHQGKCGDVMITHQRHRAPPDRGAALHPPLHRQDHRGQGRRPADDRSGSGAQPRQGHTAAPLGRDPPGAGPWRRPADRRADGPPGQVGSSGSTACG